MWEWRLTPNYSNENYHTEIKLVPNNMDYCILQFDALNIFFRGAFLWGGGSLPNFNSFNVNPQI